MMNKRLLDASLIAAAVLSVAGGLAWLATRPRAAGPELVDEARALARVGEFDRARALLGRYLESAPGDPRARLLMAQVATERPDAAPDLALEHLRGLRTSGAPQAAVARFTEGKAYYQKKRYDLAESSWKEALRLDPGVPEAGWALMELCFLEGRIADAHDLGMRQHEAEPDPRDKVRVLLEVARLDVDKPAPGSVVLIFGDLARAHPEDLTLATVLGLALVHDSRAGAGLDVLRASLARHPGSAEAWDAWLTGLDDGGRPDELADEFDKLPEALRSDPRFLKHRGQVAATRRDWKAAVKAFARAEAREPFDGVVLYRLSRAARLAGDADELARVEKRLDTYQSAFKVNRQEVTDAASVRTLGLTPSPEVYQRLADLREKMGRYDEARAWHRMVLRDAPGQPASLAALERLK